MKTMFKTIVKIIVAAMVGLMLAAWADEHHVGYRYGFVTVYFCGAIVVYYAIEGIITFIRRRKAERDDIIKFRRSIDYRQAAVFVGTACLLIGTPQECEDVCDDLWHHGQQARMEMLTGEEQAFDVM